MVSTYRGWEDDFPDRLKRLRELYKTLPKIQCRGLCHDACRTVIDMSHAERARIERASGAALPQWMRHVKRLKCPLLTEGIGGGSCSVYAMRPMICHLWGLGEGQMSCHHGCEPERRLTDREVLEYMLHSYEIGGSPVDGLDIAAIRRMLDDPELTPTVLAMAIDRDPSVQPQVEALKKRHQPPPREGGNSIG